MSRPIRDLEARLHALDRLALATRERADKETKAVYLDDSASVQTGVFVEACRRLERSSTWFPKMKELLDMCDVVAREHRIREEANRPRLGEIPTPDPERVRMWLDKIREAARGKRMPSADVPNEYDGGRTVRRVK